MKLHLPSPSIPAGTVFHAHRFRGQSGGIRIDDRAPDGNSIAAAPGTWARYGRVDFGEGRMEMAMAFLAAEGEGWRIEFRLDSPAGECIGVLPAAVTGKMDLFREQYAPISSVHGVRELFLVFPDGGIGLDWFVFSPDPACETESQRAERMRWWREARFGQFIHWGPYAVLARGEWVMYVENWSREAYETNAAARLNPVRFRAGDWAASAAQAGQKYLVVTAKHHDGFSMFDTRVRGFDPSTGNTPAGGYNILGFTPWRRDPLKELARECRRRGVRFCVYYSILDWHHASQRPVADGSGLTEMLPDRKEMYVSQMKEQLRELVERYDPDLLWFDGDWGGNGWWWTESDGRALYRFLRALKPQLVVNERVKRDFGLGDFRTPEQTIPESRLDGDWESCLTMNDHWGYHAEDRNWKSAQELVHDLVDIASKGGNLLLNVGPKPDGMYPQETRERLEAVGRWMRRFGDSIYGTAPSPFAGGFDWGRCTAKPGRLFAHIFSWPTSRILRLPPIRNTVRHVYPLGRTRNPLPFRISRDGIQIDLPASMPEMWDSVIVLDMDGMPSAE